LISEAVEEVILQVLILGRVGDPRRNKNFLDFPRTN
jgi:hypothetical protein